MHMASELPQTLLLMWNDIIGLSLCCCEHANPERFNQVKPPIALSLTHTQYINVFDGFTHLF